MRTYTAICKVNKKYEAPQGLVFELKKGKEYLISKSQNGIVTVFSNFWFQVPTEYFKNKKKFTN